MPFSIILRFVLLQISVVGQRLDIGCHLALHHGAGAQMSESLCALLTGLMTVRAVEHFYLAVSGYGKSLGRSLMCLDLSHFIYSFTHLILNLKFKNLSSIRRYPRR